MAPTTSKQDLTPELQTAGIDVRGTQIDDLAVGFETWPKGDYHGLFDGMEHGCEAAHHGYVLAGRGRVYYDDGSTEDIEAGQAYYIPPKHRFAVVEDLSVVEFTPIDDTYEATMKVFERNLPGFLKTLGAEAVA